jgi:hypothetical protein
MGAEEERGKARRKSSMETERRLKPKEELTREMAIHGTAEQQRAIGA